MIVPYQPEHLQRLAVREEQLWDHFMLRSHQREPLLTAEAKEGRAVTSITAEQEVIAFIGVLPLVDGRGYVWMLVSQHVQRLGRILYRDCQTLLPRLKQLTETPICTVLDGFKEGDRWAKRLGFHPTEECFQSGPPGRMVRVYTGGTDCGP